MIDMNDYGINVNPLWVPHQQSPEYDEETYRILHRDGYISECIVCHGMCNLGEETYYDTEEDEGPICSRECYDRFFGKDAHVEYEWHYFEKREYSKVVDKLTEKHLTKIVKQSFSEDFRDKFRLVVDLNLRIVVRDESENK